MSARRREAPVRAVVKEITPTGRALALLDDGRRLFVSGVAEGETVLVLPDRKGRHARLRAVVSPSPLRVEAPCPFVAQCGGCDLMHLPAEARRELHLRHARELLEHAGCPPLSNIALKPARDDLGYRTRARLWVRGGQVGYRRARSHQLAVVNRCIVLRPELDPVIGELGRWLASSPGEGEALVALGRGAVPVVDLHWHGVLDASAFAGAAARVEAGTWAGVRIWLEGATAPAAFGDPSPVVEGPDGLPLVLAPGGFGQASESGGAALAERVAEIVRACAPRTLVELYAGSGTLSVALAALTERFVAVEASADAARCLRDNLDARALSAKVTVADAATMTLPHGTDVVVLDPPRAGAADVMPALVRARPKHVVYVSCDATTLARDAASLCGAGYVLRSVDVFELFPQTSHFETVAHFGRS